MHIADAPILHSHRCKVVHFIAALRPVKPRRKNKSDLPERFEASIRKFIAELSEDVLGPDYIDLTAELLPVRFTLNIPDDERAPYTCVELTCPLNVNESDFRARISAIWPKSHLAGDKLFFQDRTAMFHGPNVGGVPIKDDTKSIRRAWWVRTFGE